MGNTGQISLPEGGGSVKGLGETFQPDAFTGTGNFTIPLQLPAGRNGFQPTLSLNYSTGTGNGPFGMGWRLSLPGISRKTTKGTPRYLDDDVFVLAETEELVPTGSSAGRKSFRPRTEGNFARITRIQNEAQDYWEIWSGNGWRSIYGQPRPASGDRQWRDPCALHDPADPSKIFSWKISETKDTCGNLIRYSYLRDEDPHFQQLYPEKIEYADFPDENGGRRFLVSVRFLYDSLPLRHDTTVSPDRRVYPGSDYRAGFEIRTAKRCRAIEIHTHPPDRSAEAASTAVRRYAFTYLDEADDIFPRESGSRPPANGISLLHRIQVTGIDGEKTESLPALCLQYSSFSLNRSNLAAVKGKALPALSLSDPDIELIELFGNGLPDIVETGATVRYWRNLGNGQFDLPRTMTEVPAGMKLSNRQMAIMDGNGDGLPDLTISHTALSGFYPSRPGAAWDRRSFQRYRQAPSFQLSDPELQWLDLDGNGITDVIRNGSRLELFFQHPTQGWKQSARVDRPQARDFPHLLFSDPRLKWADMSGDGMTDVVLVHDGNVEYWPNLSYGKWGQRVSMQNSPRLPAGYDPQCIHLSDIDGDGTADLVFLENGRTTCWLNQAGRGWSEPIIVTGTPPLTDPTAVRITDLYGTGTKGVLWTAPKREGRDHYFFLDVTGGTKPYLLTEIDNRMGALTKIDYAPSTAYYLEDERQPATRWQTSLPFPVQVVQHVSVLDLISRNKMTTTYRYHHGYWDGEEREFRGFGRVDIRDTLEYDRYNENALEFHTGAPHLDKTFFSPPMEIRTWYHQGPVAATEGEWITSDLSREYWQEDTPQPGWTDDYNDLLRSLDPYARRNALRSLRGRAIRTEVYANDGSPVENRPFTVSENIHGLRLEHSGEAGKGDDVFFPYTRASRNTHWERGNDPLTTFSFFSEYDIYGQLTKSLNLACPRGWKGPADSLNGAVATVTEKRYAQKDTTDSYIVDRVAEEKNYSVDTTANPSLQSLTDSLVNGDIPKTIIGHTLHFYDGEPFTGRNFGDPGNRGLLTRTEVLVLTSDILQKVHKGPLPAYYTPTGPGSWGEEYPERFLQNLPARENTDATRPGLRITPLGYGVPADNSPPFENGLYIAESRVQVSPEGLSLAAMDPLGHKVQMSYDPCAMFLTEVVDTAGLITLATYDYRVLQPVTLTDHNGNRSKVRFSPLGLTEAILTLGQAGENTGDTDAHPGTWFAYDLFAYEKSVSSGLPHPQPAWVHTFKRTEHAGALIEMENARRADAGQPVMSAPESAAYLDNLTQAQPKSVLQTREYFDGGGSVIQSRMQAEEILYQTGETQSGCLPVQQEDRPGTLAPVTGKQETADRPHVRVSGWQRMDNKGRPVEKYAPCFDTGWDYTDPSQFPGSAPQKTTLYYDPAGRVIRTVNPDNSEQRVVYGIPDHLTDPDIFAPTPWDIYIYDVNDNAGRTHAAEAGSYAQHWDTPDSAVLDPLGRTVASTSRIREQANEPPREISTGSRYHALGHLLEARDELGRTAFAYTCSLIPNTAPLRIESIDGGIRTVVTDAAGNEVERRDGKGSLILQSYDNLLRPVALWGRDAADEPVTMRQRMMYGDDPESGLQTDAARKANLLGRLYRHNDEAGRITHETYDLKGNPTETVREVFADEHLLGVYQAAEEQGWQIIPFSVDWSLPASDPLLSATTYRTSLRYDALNRVTLLQYPQDDTGHRAACIPTYHPSGALQSLEADDKRFITDIAYNACGQREFIAFGNGLLTRYAYHATTFRLARLRTEHVERPTPTRYEPKGRPLQDTAYTYDLSGNILKTSERVAGCGIPNTPQGIDMLDRLFAYDPLYRLTSASGRECALPGSAPPWQDSQRCHDHTITRSYQRSYTYNDINSISRLQHQSGGANPLRFQRNFDTDPHSNRISRLQSGAMSADMKWDANGNLLSETQERQFSWNHSDQLRTFTTQTPGSEPSLHAQYLYDGAGQRVIKLVRRQGGSYEIRRYIGDCFEHFQWKGAGQQGQHIILHIRDDQQRHALIRRGGPYPGETVPPVRYDLSDHLGSSSVVVDERGHLLNREEYYPFGETSFGSFARKRYRFSGKEMDEESGLYYQGARYYSSWTCSWISADPMGLDASMNGYTYVDNNPLRYTDPSGLQEEDAQSLQLKLHNLIEELSAKQDELESLVPKHREAHRRVKETASQLQAIMEQGAGDEARTFWVGKLNQEYAVKQHYSEKITGIRGEMDRISLQFIELVGQNQETFGQLIEGIRMQSKPVPVQQGTSISALTPEIENRSISIAELNEKNRRIREVGQMAQRSPLAALKISYMVSINPTVDFGKESNYAAVKSVEATESLFFNFGKNPNPRNLMQPKFTESDYQAKEIKLIGSQGPDRNQGKQQVHVQQLGLQTYKTRKTNKAGRKMRRRIR